MTFIAIGRFFRTVIIIIIARWSAPMKKPVRNVETIGLI